MAGPVRCGPNHFHARLRIHYMINDNMAHQRAESPIGNIAYLARSQHCVPTFVALTDRPRSRSERCELAGVSSSTIRRALDEFEDIEEDRFLSSHQWTTSIQHDESAVTCLNSVTTSSGDDCWTRWSE